MNTSQTLGLIVLGLALYFGYRFTRSSGGSRKTAPVVGPVGAAGGVDDGAADDHGPSVPTIPPPPPAAVSGLVGGQRMQGGLPLATQKVWTDLVATFGPQIVGLGAWGDKSHGPTSCHYHGKAIDATIQRGKVRTATEKAVGDRIAARYVGGRLGVTQVIWDRRIATAARGWTWRPYNGVSGHTEHVHLSIECPPL